MHQDLSNRVRRFACFALHLLEEIPLAADNLEPEEIRSNCLELLTDFDRDDIQPQTARFAKYALTTWLDDRLSRAAWRYAAGWNARPLEQQLFGSTSRHWRFFEQAEQARNQQDWEALRVFQFCVEHGFQGIYAQPRPQVQLKDRLPMARAHSLTTQAVYAEVRSGQMRENSSLPSRFLPEASVHLKTTAPAALPASLAEWSQAMFSGLTPESFGSPLPKSQMTKLWGEYRHWSEWAIVLGVGLLLMAVILAIGH